MGYRSLSEALPVVAQRWSDPAHEPRAEAARRTLDAENRFTAEGLTFALNHTADLVARGGVEAWVGNGLVPFDGAIGVIFRGRTPAEGLLETLAALMVGSEVLFAAPAASPAIVKAFMAELADETGEQRSSAGSEAVIAGRVHALVATGNAADRQYWHEQCTAAGLSPQRQLLRPIRTGVAILDGSEQHAALSGLAEDILLHEGGTPQSVRIVLAPQGHSPDDLLNALAGFREVFPAHPETAGSLAMRVALLEAMGTPLAVGPGFLVTRGEFEPQEGAHLRWVEYGSFDEVVGALASIDPSELFLTASPPVAETLAGAGLPGKVPVLGFGDAHRPEVGQPPLTPEVPAFLRRLGAE